MVALCNRADHYVFVIVERGLVVVVVVCEVVCWASAADVDIVG